MYVASSKFDLCRELLIGNKAERGGARERVVHVIFFARSGNLAKKPDRLTESPRVILFCGLW